jgi:hypothetical protein
MKWIEIKVSAYSSSFMSAETPLNLLQITVLVLYYRVFRAQADWTFILSSELPAKALRQLPRKMPARGTTF